jgi:hypothetical protein
MLSCPASPYAVFVFTGHAQDDSLLLEELGASKMDPHNEQQTGIFVNRC